MDRDFRNPEDVARATAEQVRQSLAKILRRGVSAKSFCIRLKFEFSGGRAEPVLFIGNLEVAEQAEVLFYLIDHRDMRNRVMGLGDVRLNPHHWVGYFNVLF